MSATSYSNLFLFLSLKMFDVYQMLPGEVPLHTTVCHLGLAWASPASPRGCSGAAPAPRNAGTRTILLQGQTSRAGSAGSSAPCREGLSPGWCARGEDEPHRIYNNTSVQHLSSKRCTNIN